MPTYEYACSKCDEKFELFQSIKDNALETCPKDRCNQKRWGKGKVKRVIGAGAGLIFKGSGFYITDYRSDNYKEAAKKDSASTTPAATSTESKGSESKPAAAKTDSKPAAAASGSAS
ncbi:MAG: zinc ribbon domain-containing protein [Verrucomicrobia bacterium]|nr:zinc ribbon domain-containing protein [Verrucomicrobiota bacterium]